MIELFHLLSRSMELSNSLNKMSMIISKLTVSNRMIPFIRILMNKILTIMGFSKAMTSKIFVIKMNRIIMSNRTVLLINRTANRIFLTLIMINRIILMMIQ